jgi:hypothetical protein
MLNWNNPIVENADVEQQFDYVRVVRNAELVATDWAMVSDAPTDKEAWAAYRQALRDLPKQNADPKEIIFPAPPNQNEVQEILIVDEPLEGEQP